MSPLNDPSVRSCVMGRARPGWRATSGVAWRTKTNQRNHKIMNTYGNIFSMCSRMWRSRLHKIRRTAKQSNERMIVSTRGEQRMHGCLCCLRDPQCVCTTPRLTQWLRSSECRSGTRCNCLRLLRDPAIRFSLTPDRRHCARSGF